MTIETRPVEVVSAPKVKTTADVLRHAALIIEERGWLQGIIGKPEGPMCVAGAIRVASGDQRWNGPPWGLNGDVLDYLAAYLGRKAAAYFNDDGGRTAAEVTAALRAAADASERAS